MSHAPSPAPSPAPTVSRVWAEALGRPEVPGYEVLGLLGRGGMGAVYEAEQHEPRRRVALKVLPAAALDPEGLARFALERDAIARMDHPNVARVFEAGTTRTGAPFLAMELVRGGALLAFCADRGLALPDRLRLFADVCRAVQHAHQKGVIHRDLKPSNILVAEADGRAVPKVIDFGLAKLVEQARDGGPHLTHTGCFAGTPLYMAPEQLDSGAAARLDTRADVYALGVVLFELLTGTAPIPAEQLSNYGAIVAAKSRVAPRPSAAAPPELAGRLRGDLDGVVARCLERDPADRYPTAAQLADDIDRYLRDEPVTARRPSALYLARKFVRRNRLPVAAAVAAVALLAAGTVGTTVGLIRAERARDAERRRAAAEEAARTEAEAARTEAEAARAEAEAARGRESAQRRAAEASAARAAEAEADTAAFLRFMADRVLAAARPLGMDGGLGRDVSLRDALAAAEQHLDRDFRDRPRAEALARLEFGATWHELGDTTRAVPHTERAVELRRRHLGDDHDDTTAAVNRLAVLLQASGRPERAAELFAELAARTEGRKGPNHLDALTLWSNWAQVQWELGRSGPAIDRFELVLAALERHHGADQPQAVTIRNNLANAYLAAGRPRDALRELERVVVDQERVRGANHPQTDATRSNLALALLKLNRPADARAILEPLLPRYQERFGHAHPQTLRLRSNLATVYLNTGQLARGVALLEDNRAAARAAGLERTALALITDNNLAHAYAQSGDYGRAIALHRATLEGRTAALGPDHPEALSSANNLGHALWRSGDPAAARPYFEQALCGSTAVLGPDHPQIQSVGSNLVFVLFALGDPEAQTLADGTRARLARTCRPDDPRRVGWERQWIEWREDRGDWAAARDARAALLLVERKAIPAGHPDLGDRLVGLGHAEQRCGRFPEAEAALREALAICEKAAPGAWTTANTRSLLGEALLAQKRYADAAPLLRSGYEGLKARSAEIPPASRRARLSDALDRLIRLAAETGDAAARAGWEAERAALLPELAPPPRPRPPAPELQP